VSKSSVVDLVDVRRFVISGDTVACEVMPCQDDGMLLIREHVFDLLLEGSTRDLHRLAGKFIQPRFTYVDARDAAAAWRLKDKIGRTRLQIAVDITAAKSRVSFANDCL